MLKTVVAKKHSLAITVLFNLNRSKEQLGTILLIDENLKSSGKQTEKVVLDLILEQAQLTLENKRSHFAEFNIVGETQHLFIQNYQPPVKLIIVGAGNDAQILARQGDLLGWDVIVTDGRPTHANKERFASSCQVIVTKPELTLKNIEIDQRSCFVLMSHNYNYDLAVLKLLLAEPQIPYIGILGPLKKFERMQNDLEKEGIELSEENRNKIHAPVGLEIGAETPAEIGLSILSEVQSVLTQTSAIPLREKSEPIHEKSENRFKKIVTLSCPDASGVSASHII